MSAYRTFERVTLGAEERLKLRNHIETLFQEGEAFSVLGLRVVYLLTDTARSGAAPARVGVSIPKKKIRKAHDRNRIRRLLKEAWRLQKATLYKSIPSGKQLHCFLIYTSPLNARQVTFTIANEYITKCIEKLSSKYIQQ